ncbi:hypothetical protein [Streptomyces sp. SBT349]|uniref:hypothetical protein n=1 Tax=Streptomyces sp. SBT349 TaxID=1580539 RepID=UPI00066B0498|nr:hypothetical protein [Streptomyces sp. SBT349]
MISTLRGARRTALCSVALLVAAPGAAPVWTVATAAAAPRTPADAGAGADTEAAADQGSSSGLGAFARIRTGAHGATPALAEVQATHPAGPQRVSLATVAFGSLGSARGVTAAATGDDATGRVGARAGVDGADIDFGPAVLRTGPVYAHCSAVPGAEPEGSAVLTEAAVTVPRVAEITFDRAPAPGTTVELPDGIGRAVLNEHTAEADGSLTVSALRLRVDGHELTLGSVTCRPGATFAAEGSGGSGESGGSGQGRGPAAP